MLDNIIVRILHLPKLFLGFVIIVLVLLAIYYNDPPKTLCDIQMEEIQKNLRRGFYANDERGSYRKSIGDALKFCLSSNSSGGCHDLFTRFEFFEKRIRSLPTNCGFNSAALPVRKALQKSLRLFAEIGWGGKPPESKYNNVSWLDSFDLGLYCRLKRQYLRLYGNPDWQTFTQSVVFQLPGAETLKGKEILERSLFSYPCKGLY